MFTSSNSIKLHSINNIMKQIISHPDIVGGNHESEKEIIPVKSKASTESLDRFLGNINKTPVLNMESEQKPFSPRIIDEEKSETVGTTNIRTTEEQSPESPKTTPKKESKKEEEKSESSPRPKIEPEPLTIPKISKETIETSVSPAVEPQIIKSPTVKLPEREQESTTKEEPAKEIPKIENPIKTPVVEKQESSAMVGSTSNGYVIFPDSIAQDKLPKEISSLNNVFFVQKEQQIEEKINELKTQNTNFTIGYIVGKLGKSPGEDALVDCIESFKFVPANPLFAPFINTEKVVTNPSFKPPQVKQSGGSHYKRAYHKYKLKYLLGKSQ